jgi:lipoprotein-releasing system permease protein
VIRLLLDLAVTHVAGRGRQTVVSIAGVALGVGFSIAMAALMQGSQDDLTRTLVEESPHVTVSVDTRRPRPQVASEVFDATAYSGLRPTDDRRGILNPVAVRASLESWVPGRIAATMTLQAVVRYGGNDAGVTVIGIDPAEYDAVSTLASNMTVGRLDGLSATSAGAILGDGVAEDLGATVGDTVTVTSAMEVTRRFKVTGLFHSGVAAEDDQLVYVLLRNAQTLAQQPTAVNAIRVKLDDPYEADAVAARVEALLGLDAESWQERNASLMEALLVRNTIMYTVVGAILLVAGFGIFNIVSTITHEKARDIAILKSLGFRAADMRRLFLLEGLAMGAVGSVFGWAIGYALTVLLGSIRFEIRGEVDITHLPVVFDPVHYALAAAFALAASGIAGYLPARKASRLNPVDIIRGAT